MRIIVYYFDGCPSWEDGIENLEAALDAVGIEASVSLVNVETGEDAQRFKFLGSPSFQVDGQDLWPEERDAYALACRVYATPDGMRGAPTVAMFRQALLARVN